MIGLLLMWACGGDAPGVNVAQEAPSVDPAGSQTVKRLSSQNSERHARFPPLPMPLRWGMIRGHGMPA